MIVALRAADLAREALLGRRQWIGLAVDQLSLIAAEFVDDQLAHARRRELLVLRNRLHERMPSNATIEQQCVGGEIHLLLELVGHAHAFVATHVFHQTVAVLDLRAREVLRNALAFRTQIRFGTEYDLGCLEPGYAAHGANVLN